MGHDHRLASAATSAMQHQMRSTHEDLGRQLRALQSMFLHHASNDIRLLGTADALEAVVEDFERLAKSLQPVAAVYAGLSRTAVEATDEMMLEGAPCLG